MEQQTAWTLYWVDKNSFSFIADSVQKQLDSRWAAFVNRLDEKNEIADLACGNGAIYKSLCAQRVSKSLSLHCFDTAKIFIEEQSDTSVTVKAYPEQNWCAVNSSTKFDAVISQFGIEYMPIVSAVESIRRNCNEHAHVYFIIHAEDSVVMKKMRDSSAVYEKILASELLDKFGEFLSLLLDKDPNIAQLALSYQIEQLNEEIATINADLLDFAEPLGMSEIVIQLQQACGQIFTEKDQRSLEESLKALAILDLEIKGANARATAMIEAAEGNKQRDLLLAELGDNVKCSPLLVNGQLIAYEIVGRF